MSKYSVAEVIFDIKADTSHLVKSTDKAHSYMKKQVGNIKTTVLSLATAYISVQTAMKGLEQVQRSINLSSEFEKLETVLKTVEGSTIKTEQSMQWIENFSKYTPYKIKQVTESFVSLRTYGLEPTNGLLKTLGDTSSAMNKPLQQSVEAIADAIVGENERLKEFGIRAEKMGEEIKYSWINSSGEARQTIISNNSDIIESTLESIFNSKYAGAMEEQSKTLNGMLSNMSDNWTIYQKKVMDGGLYDYFKAVVFVVNDEMSKAFENNANIGIEYSNIIIESINSTILGFGKLYDVLETVGDSYNVVRYSAETSFWGIQVVTASLSRFIQESMESSINYVVEGFEDMINNVVNGINTIIGQANSTGLVNFSYVSSVDYEKVDFGIEGLLEREAYVKENFELASENLKLAYEDLFTTSNDGFDLAQKFITDVNSRFKEIRNNNQDISSEKPDFGDSASNASDVIDNINDQLTDYQVDSSIIDKIKDTSDLLSFNLENATDATKKYIDVMSEEDGLNYTIKEQTYTTEKLVNESKAVVSVFNEATEEIKEFIFQFEDTFINSLKTNADYMQNVFSQDTNLNKTLSYIDALEQMQEAQQNLLNNPLDVQIGQQYQESFQAFVESTEQVLNSENYSTNQDYIFAQATVGNQISSFQNNALDAYNVFTSMNDLLTSINKSFEDGILTDDEKTTISNVADSVNVNNEKLLGSNSSLIKSTNYITSAVNDQEYYNNSNLAKSVDLTQNTNSVTAALSTVNSSVGNINIPDVELDTEPITLALNGTNSNSVTDFIQKLMGGNSTGISLSSISSSFPELSVDTGLDVSSLSNISANTATTAVNANNTKNAVTSMAGGKSLRNLQVKRVTEWTQSYGDGTTSTNIAYQYYAKGGYTGVGHGLPDHTGHKQAKIITHDNEWIAPKWMVTAYPSLFSFLEKSRKNRGLISGNLKKASNEVKSISIESNNSDNGLSDKYLFVVADELKKMNRILSNVTNNGEAMLTEAV
ncbi:tape measure protein [Arcobacter roscoffensis]|uniref:Tape measure protein n=1 Tax=Arcobacter roscoffensis TaxID=2961520 RepID=A0ABY5DZK4_9BACT|nr:tape measure protein [Arcobacter roscoffensis]UTJ05387.1 tape measure protein [Arcobacter roscoffensis]